VYHRKPIIGIVGGIGSGKSYVARLFGELGCLVIDADVLVSEAYADPAVRQRLREWWGDAAFRDDGSINRSTIAAQVFRDEAERKRLEGLLHPWVNARRREIMAAAPADVVAFVWDTPLLLETGLNRECDALVFVEAPEAERLARVAAQRGWNADELRRREKLQMPLDKKRELSDDVVVNSAPGVLRPRPAAQKPAGDATDAGDAEQDQVRCQVREILSRIVTGLPNRLQRG
jgi:dephospho-CoA kinase